MKKTPKKKCIRKDDVLGIRKIIDKPVTRKIVVGGIAVLVSSIPYVAFGCSRK